MIQLKVKIKRKSFHPWYGAFMVPCLAVLSP